MSTSAFSRRADKAPEQQAQRVASESKQITAPAGWFGDPLKRFEGRFFDGDQWTSQVSDDGVLRVDPSWAAAPPVTTPATKNEFAGTERRGAQDRRQINIEVAVDRRKGDRRDR